MKRILLLFVVAFISQALCSQRFINTGIKVPVVPDEKITIFFDRPVRQWDGFGINYVEACQTRDYSKFKQDYSGFSFATPETRELIMELIFGEDGLRPALTKMFLDPFHEGMTRSGNDNDDPMKINMDKFDHLTSTAWMRYFNREGLKMMKQWGGSLTGIVTLYGSPPWMTSQKYILGRDLDPAEKYELAEYLVSWAKYLTDEEGIPIRYVSLHNEGDAYYRWPRDGSNPGEDHRDYNMFWPPEQVADMIKVVRKVLDTNDMDDVSVTPGETQTWYRFDMWGYADAIVSDKQSLDALGLITSHSFAVLDIPNSVYYGDYRSIGQDMIQSKRPELKVWVTSRPWTDGIVFLDNIRRDIYESKANGVIPWALISGAKQWLDSDGSYTDGSMDKAFLIKEDGSLVVHDQYYFYKQVTRAGQPGMNVVRINSFDPSIRVIAFASNNSGHPDSFVIINKSDEEKEIEIRIEGTNLTGFRAYRTSEKEKYRNTGLYKTDENDIISYSAPSGSVTTFFAE